MPVQLICPNPRCRKFVAVADEARGEVVECRHCRTTFRVPDAPKPPTLPARPATAAK